eukprot:GFUD01000878.1.p1 GENE.GFUD01000878.1~~GFUD01000878.1.p1  ORF type:complete len:218 (+),score=66.06 GFUD01000878.1:184-837(+)
MGSSLSAEVLELIDNRLEYQGAVSSQQFRDSSSQENLACVNCLRVEMGEIASFSGICAMCGGVPPDLQWMYPGSSRRGQMRTERSRGRRRPPQQEQPRSSSSDRTTTGTRESASSGNRRYQRRRSADNTVPSIGLSKDRIERSSFKQTYSQVKGEDCQDKEWTTCVICIQDFLPGTVVRRLACLHLFHTDCVDAWLMNNRCCPVCRLDMEQAAAMFR